MRTFLHYYHWGILWVLVIFVLTCIPGNYIPKVPRFIDLLNPDKLVHVTLFTVLIFLLLLGLMKHLNKSFEQRIAVMIALNIGVFLGGITELLQGTSWVIGRHCSVYDFIANVTGCFLGWGLFVLWMKKNNKTWV